MFERGPLQDVESKHQLAMVPLGKLRCAHLTAMHVHSCLGHVLVM
jgi:hypothetical protein